MKSQYDIPEPSEAIRVASLHFMGQDRWLLTVRTNKTKATSVAWMCIDNTVKVDRSDKKSYTSGYPYEAIQIWPGSRYPSPPFTLDVRTKNAILRTTTELGVESIDNKKTGVLPKKFLPLLLGRYRRF